MINFIARAWIWFKIKILRRKLVPNPIGGSDFRNLPCPCLSGEKIKNCCGRSRYVEESWAKSLVAGVRKRMAESE